MIGGNRELRADRLRDPSEADKEDILGVAVALGLCIASIAAVCAIMWLGT